MKLLHIDSSVLGPGSASRALTADIVARQVKLHPGLKVIYRDLASDAALHLSPDRKSTRLNSSHRSLSRMPSSA